MDIVVRTPHGDADVSIVEQTTTTTLGDVIGAVTGQAVPRLALVDGHVVDCSTRLGEAGLLIGSVVTTEPALPAPASHTAVELVQIAGRGAGRIVRLEPGRYRIGPGRRATADELELSPVEHAAFDLHIDATDGAIATTTIDPGRSQAQLDGVTLDGPTPWPNEPGRGTLTVGSRAFRLGLTALADAEHPMSAPAMPDGTMAFSRPPRHRTVAPRLPVVDAVRDATARSSTLWERRADHADAFALPFGVHLDESATTTATVELAADRAVAITGSERFRSALARTLLIEAVTLHGPADLDVVVLTSPGDLAEWDWAKWLPHVRHHAGPAIWSTESDIARWTSEVGRHDSGGARSPLRTLVIADDASLWNRPGSPAQPILTRLPNHLLLLALCTDIREAPAVCRSVVAETPTGLGRTQSFDRNADLDDVRVALTETAVAAGVARSLAPLVDIELEPPDPDVSDPASPVDLDTLIGISDTSEIIGRWTGDEQTPTLVIGFRDGHPVDVDADAAVTAVVGSSMSDAADIATSWLLAQCATRPPDACWVTPLGPVDSEHTELLWQLPHATERHDPTAPIAADRLVARLRAVLDDEAGPERILLVARDTHTAPALFDDGLLQTLVGAAHDLPGVGLLIITDRAELDTAGADVVIRVDRDHRPGAGGRRAAVGVGNGPLGAPFTPLEPSPNTEDRLDLRPTVVGRPFTALERRLERMRATTAPDAAFAGVVSLLRDAADRRLGSADTAQPNRVRPDRVVVPAPLPMRLDLDELFSAWPGDGVPLGVVDDPATGRLQPVWWQPGTGATLLFGSRRSGVEQVLSTIVEGIADRFAPDDVRLVVVDRSATRRRALSEHDHTAVVVDADRNEEVADMVAELERRLTTASSTIAEGAREVVLIGDIAQLRRGLADTELLDRLDAVLSAACTDEPPFDVVAYASELAATGPFADLAPRRLVGTSSDPNELVALGVEHPAELDGVVGRCRSHPNGDLIQLAMSTAPLETRLAQRPTGGTS